jgi:hypothetical protein
LYSNILVTIETDVNGGFEIFQINQGRSQLPGTGILEFQRAVIIIVIPASEPESKSKIKHDQVIVVRTKAKRTSQFSFIYLSFNAGLLPQICPVVVGLDKIERIGHDQAVGDFLISA